MILPMKKTNRQEMFNKDDLDLARSLTNKAIILIDVLTEKIKDNTKQIGFCNLIEDCYYIGKILSTGGYFDFASIKFGIAIVLISIILS